MKNIKQIELRNFGFIVGFGLPTLIGFLIPAMFGHSFRVWTLWIGIPLIIMAVIKPMLLRFIYELWMSFGDILGWINSRIILSIVFLLVAIPISFLMKIFGYDPLNFKFSKKDTYREIKSEHKINFTKIF